MSILDEMTEKPKIIAVETVVDTKKEAAALADMIVNLHLAATTQIGKIRSFRHEMESPLEDKGKWKLTGFTLPSVADYLADFLEAKRATKDTDVIAYPIYRASDELISQVQKDAYTDELCLAILDEEVWDYLEENEMARTETDGTKTLVFGGCGAMWHIQKELMKQRFCRNWKSPEELYPNVLFD